MFRRGKLLHQHRHFLLKYKKKNSTINACNDYIQSINNTVSDTLSALKLYEKYASKSTVARENFAKFAALVNTKYIDPVKDSKAYKKGVEIQRECTAIIKKNHGIKQLQLIHKFTLYNNTPTDTKPPDNTAPLFTASASIGVVGTTSGSTVSFDSTVNLDTSSAIHLTNTVTATTDTIPDIPAVPDIAELLTTAGSSSEFNALGEATFTSIGLGGWTPVGIVQQAFEYLHIGLGVPWWMAIIIGTMVIRFAMLPLVIVAQRNAAKMNNNLPGMQAIQVKMTEARQSGNQLDVARYSQELMTFMKEKNVNPFKNMVVPLAQMPVFISFFMGLRQMANVPVDSMRTGGLFWFTDLTVPDQFYLMPVITSITLWATIELGTDAAKLNSQNLQTMKYVLRALPLVIIPFTLNFPGAILTYWAASNFISLAQVGVLRIPAVRDWCGIEAQIRHDASTLPVKSKGFVEGIKDSWTNVKITKELEERRRIDDMQFQRAGKGPVVKTYKFDPTKVTAESTVTVKK